MDKPYYTLEEVAELLGIKRASVYNYMKALDITPTRFKGHRLVYLTREEVNIITMYKKSPWMIHADTIAV